MVLGPKQAVKKKVSRGKEGRKCLPPQSLKHYCTTTVSGESNGRSGEENGHVFRKCGLVETTFAFDMCVSFCCATQRQTVNIDIDTRFVHIVCNSYNKKFVKT